MSKIRRGLNQRNLDYWRDVVFYGYQGKSLELATLYKSLLGARDK